MIQGVAEFLPISSSGHLSIAQNLFGLSVEGSNDMFFDVLLHLGTLAAVFVAYWAEIREMIVEFFSAIGDFLGGRKQKTLPPARRLIGMIIVGTLPLFAILPVKDVVEKLSQNTYFIGAALLVTGCLLTVCDRMRKGKKTEASAGMLDALIVGVGQAIATCPGISRSGMTISVGCFCGFERKFAVRFAFLLSIPAVLGANILEIADVMETGIDTTLLPMYFAGVLVAAVSGYLCIRLLKMIAENGKFGAFAYYCWGMGVVTIVLTALKTAGMLPWLN
ncbi:MAG: undecaprenyl-diphosphate phosphatase [Oscillospiraceae bacterium]|nr:undecaprenyl-diphosphate phosphatase [Oscillospiraceae bacterium]